jgi:MraZ protein
VSLPAPFRREAADQRFVLLQPYPPSLALYPEGEWLQVEDRVRDLLKHQPDARIWVLRMMSSAVECAPDNQGRILIPSRLKDSAQLKDQALLVGAIDKIEIWNPTLFESATSAEADRFSQYAPNIFR